MALMDAYGLSLMSVQAWGLLWGALSTGFILGGLAVAKTGLGKSPVRLLLLINIVLWSVTCLFPLQSSVILLTAGMAVYMVLMPYAEAAERPSCNGWCRSSGRAESSASRKAWN